VGKKRPQRYDFPMLAREIAQSKRHIDYSLPRPVVLGTDIKVSQIAREAVCVGMTPDEVVCAHPHLTLADVHAALTYYYDHQEAIRQDWATSEAQVADFESRSG